MQWKDGRTEPALMNILLHQELLYEQRRGISRLSIFDVCFNATHALCTTGSARW